jgi:hypothetical protein
VLGQRRAQTIQHGLVAQEKLERPRQPRRRRLVPCDEQRHELVAQLLVGHRTAVLVAREKKHREHVLALVEVGSRAAKSDFLVDELVEVPAALLESPKLGWHTEPPAG